MSPQKQTKRCKRKSHKRQTRKGGGATPGAPKVDPVAKILGLIDALRNEIQNLPAASTAPLVRPPVPQDDLNAEGNPEGKPEDKPEDNPKADGNPEGKAEGKAEGKSDTKPTIKRNFFGKFPNIWGKS